MEAVLITTALLVHQAEADQRAQELRSKGLTQAQAEKL